MIFHIFVCMMTTEYNTGFLNLVVTLCSYWLIKSRCWENVLLAVKTTAIIYSPGVVSTPGPSLYFRWVICFMRTTEQVGISNQITKICIVIWSFLTVFIACLNAQTVSAISIVYYGTRQLVELWKIEETILQFSAQWPGLWMAARLEVTLFWYRPHCFCCVNRVF